MTKPKQSKPAARQKSREHFERLQLSRVRSVDRVVRLKFVPLPEWLGESDDVDPDCLLCDSVRAVNSGSVPVRII